MTVVGCRLSVSAVSDRGRLVPSAKQPITDTRSTLPRASRLHGTAGMKRSLVYAVLLTGICLTLAAITLTLSGCSTIAKGLNIENPRYSLRDIRPRVDIAIPL